MVSMRVALALAINHLSNIVTVRTVTSHTIIIHTIRTSPMVTARITTIPVLGMRATRTTNGTRGHVTWGDILICAKPCRGYSLAGQMKREGGIISCNMACMRGVGAHAAMKVPRSATTNGIAI